MTQGNEAHMKPADNVTGLRMATPEEEMFCYANNTPAMMSGLIGYLRMDFDNSGTGWYSTWWDKQPSLKTDDFRHELDNVVNALRDNPVYGGVLKDRASMSHFLSQQPRRVYVDQPCFRLDTENRSYLLRCNPRRGDYNGYLYCYERSKLDRILSEQTKSVQRKPKSHEEVR